MSLRNSVVVKYRGHTLAILRNPSCCFVQSTPSIVFSGVELAVSFDPTIDDPTEGHLYRYLLLLWIL